jgi:hypothetical protein
MDVIEICEVSVCLGITEEMGVRLLEIELGSWMMARQALVHEAVSNGAKVS